MPPPPSHLTHHPHLKNLNPFNSTLTHLKSVYLFPSSLSTLSLDPPYISHELPHRPPNQASCLQICLLKSVLPFLTVIP